VKNITDEEYRINGIPMGDATGAFIGGINYYGDPATYGLEVSYQFQALKTIVSPVKKWPC
jgi:iron complex outermembrane receptor protein